MSLYGGFSPFCPAQKTLTVSAFAVLNSAHQTKRATSWKKKGSELGWLQSLNKMIPRAKINTQKIWEEHRPIWFIPQRRIREDQVVTKIRNWQGFQNEQLCVVGQMLSRWMFTSYHSSKERQKWERARGPSQGEGFIVTQEHMPPSSWRDYRTPFSRPCSRRGRSQMLSPGSWFPKLKGKPRRTLATSAPFVMCTHGSA